MNDILETMINQYNPQTIQERENAIKEVIQEIALSGLSHSGFFDKAAFYGGTCLRIFHGLDRFSEDLDFACVGQDSNFDLEDYFPSLKSEFASYGLNLDVEKKKKASGLSPQSPCLKGNAFMLTLLFFPNNAESAKVVSNQKIKIKFEVDVDNPPGGTTEFKYRMLPIPYGVRVFDESSLFSGKIHALICRDFAHRVKGRDYYDYLFYVGRGCGINLAYLEAKLKNTGGKIGRDETLTLPKVKQLLENRFSSTDYEAAKQDVIPFIKDKNKLAFWGKELFLSTLDGLKTSS